MPRVQKSVASHVLFLPKKVQKYDSSQKNEIEGG